MPDLVGRVAGLIKYRACVPTPGGQGTLLNAASERLHTKRDGLGALKRCVVAARIPGGAGWLHEPGRDGVTRDSSDRGWRLPRGQSVNAALQWLGRGQARPASPMSHSTGCLCAPSNRDPAQDGYRLEAPLLSWQTMPAGHPSARTLLPSRAHGASAPDDGTRRWGSRSR